MYNPAVGLDQIRRLLNQFWVFAASAFLLANHKVFVQLVSSLVSKNELGHWYYAFVPQNGLPQSLENLAMLGMAGLAAEFLLFGCVLLARAKDGPANRLIGKIASTSRENTARSIDKGNLEKDGG